MADKLKPWYEWLPGWVPICFAIFGAALWIGQYTQNVSDRLATLERAVKDIQAYLYANPRALPPQAAVGMPGKVE
jgi:hypothetical protein